jgi:hypothetical protein
MADPLAGLKAAQTVYLMAGSMDVQKVDQLADPKAALMAALLVKQTADWLVAQFLFQQFDIDRYTI